MWHCSCPVDAILLNKMRLICPREFAYFVLSYFRLMPPYYHEGKALLYEIKSNEISPSSSLIYIWLGDSRSVRFAYYHQSIHLRFHLTEAKENVWKCNAFAAPANWNMKMTSASSALWSPHDSIFWTIFLRLPACAWNSEYRIAYKYVEILRYWNFRVSNVSVGSNRFQRSNNLMLTESS